MALTANTLTANTRTANALTANMLTANTLTASTPECCIQGVIEGNTAANDIINLRQLSELLPVSFMCSNALGIRPRLGIMAV